jgi:hypothetical protein
MPGDRRLERVPRPTAGLPTEGLLRVVRGAAVGTSAMGLALAGHLAGGGPLPTSTNAVALTCVVVAGGVALSGRRWTVSALFTVLLGVQVVCHVAFANHPGQAGVAQHNHAAHSLTASMVVSHVLAACVTALLLSRGEAWCWRLMALLSRPVQVVRWFDTHSVPATGPGCVPSGEGPSSSLRSLLLADAQPRRGPPALLAR